jgi:predicted pyridoxine 5'-phosphate oxidase superfamily flavin-nucleotide-binding protein
VAVEGDPDRAAALADPSYQATVERAVIVHVEAFDWNCPQHITPRFTAAEIESAVAALRSEVEALRAENAALRQNRPGTS